MRNDLDPQVRIRELEQQLSDCQRKLEQAKADLQFSDSRLTLERQQLGELLRSSEAMWQQTFELMQDVFFLKEINTGNLLFINSAYERLYQRSRDLLYEHPNSWIDAVHPEDREAIRAKYGQEVRGDSFFDEEYRIVRPDGSIRWIWNRSFPILNEAGEIYRFAGISRDISDRKQSEAERHQTEIALRTANDEMQALFAAMDDLVLVRDGAGRFIKTLSPKDNPLFYKSADEMMGRPLHEIFPAAQADQIGQAIQASLARRQPVKIEYSLPIRGEEIWFDTTLSPLSNGTVLLVGRNISRRKQSELALQQQVERQFALRRLIQMIRNSLDLNTIFATTVREVGEVLQIDQADIVCYLPARRIWLNLADYRRNPGMPSGLGVEIPDQENQIAAQLKQGKIVEIEDYQQYDDEANRPLRGVYTQGGNWLHVPVWGEGQIWGCLSLNREVGQKWRSSEIELARAVADQLAIAIQQANLYQQAQRELAERQRAEMALQHLNQELEERVYQRTTQLQMALSSAAMGLWEWNMLNDTEVWSPENYVLLGFQTDGQGRVLDLDGTVLSPCPTYSLFLSRLHPDDRERLFDAQEQALEQRSLYEIEYRIVLPDGTTRWRYNRGAYLFDEQGQPYKLMGVCIDIHQRKQAEAALQQSEEQFRTIFDNAPIAISLARVTDFRLDRVNKAHRKLFGYSEEDLKTLTALDITHPDDVEQNVDLVKQMKQGDRNTFEMEKRFIKKNGDIIWATLTSALIRDSDGTPLYIMGMIQDITQRKQVELALSRSESRFQRIVANIPGVIYQFKIAADGMRSFPYMSSLAAQIFGVDTEEILQDANVLFSRIHPDDRVLLEQATVSSTHHLHQWQWEGRFICPDGKIRWLEGMANPEQQPNGDVIWDGVIIDVSDRVQVKQTLQQLYLQLQIELAERKQAELLVKQQATADHLMAEIAQLINQSIHLETVLHASLERVRDFFAVDRVFVYRFHPDWSGVVEIEVVSQPQFSLRGQTVADECFVQRVATQYQQGYITTIPDVHNSGLSLCHQEFLTQLQVAANLVAPILKSDRVWGLLIIHQCQSARAWQPFEIDFLSQLATQVGTAIQKADLYQQLEGELVQKDVLLKEIHHRVKNNLQIISSLLRMQSRHQGEESVMALFQEAQNRVQSMALIHEHLYQVGDLSQIDFEEYLHTLVNNLFRSYGIGEQITLEIATHGLTLTLNTAIPCGLIVNELVSNSLKYAFPHEASGHICLKLELEPAASTDAAGQIKLLVSDNGIGIPESINWQTTSSLGLRIVRNLVDQINGKISLTRQSGTLFQISFPQTSDRH